MRAYLYIVMRNVFLSMLLKRMACVIAFSIMQITCFAQKFDGDWTGKIAYQGAKGYTKEVLFHIVGEECSEELVQRSAAEIKEQIIEMSIDGDSITLETRQSGTFKGKLTKGKIIGNCVLGKYTRRLTLSKIGKGVIDAEINRQIDKRKGLVFY